MSKVTITPSILSKYLDKVEFLYPGSRYRTRAGNAFDRGSDGHRYDVRPGVLQGGDRQWQRLAVIRHRVRLARRSRQAGGPRGREAPA